MYKILAKSAKEEKRVRVRSSVGIFKEKCLNSVFLVCKGKTNFGTTVEQSS